MKTTTLPTLLIVTLALTTLTGCIYSREITDFRRDMERQYPGLELDQGVSVRFGPGMMRTLGWISRRVPEPEAQMVADYLNEVERVHVGYYPVADAPPLEDVDLPVMERLERDGWELAVKVVEDDERVWMFYRERFDTIHDIYVVVLTEEELVITSIEGHLDYLFALALEDHAEFLDVIEF